MDHPEPAPSISNNPTKTSCVLVKSTRSAFLTKNSDESFHNDSAGPGAPPWPAELLALTNTAPTKDETSPEASVREHGIQNLDGRKTVCSFASSLKKGQERKGRPYDLLYFPRPEQTQK